MHEELARAAEDGELIGWVLPYLVEVFGFDGSIELNNSIIIFARCGRR